MQKKELQDLTSLSELKKYEASKEYQDILTKCNNRKEQIQTTIKALYNEDKVDREFDYDFHDRGFKLMKFFEDRLEEIKSESKAADALRQEVLAEIKNLDSGLTSKVMDNYLNVYSNIRFTGTDMLRMEAGFNDLFPTLLNGLINLLEKEPVKEEEIY